MTHYSLFTLMAYCHTGIAMDEGDSVSCTTCGGAQNGRTGATLGSSAISICCVVLRRTNPKSWPSKGIPPLFDQYGRLYDVLMQSMPLPAVDGQQTSDEDMLTVFEIEAVKGTDPQVLAETLEGIQAKRAVFAGSTTIPKKATEVLIYVLPVDSDGESHDGSGVEDFVYDKTAWISLHSLLLDMRGLRSRGPLNLISPGTQRIMTVVDQYLADAHSNARIVSSLWQPRAQTLIKQLVTNPCFAHTTPPDSIFRKAPRAVFNPLFKSNMLLPRLATTREVLFKNDEEYQHLPAYIRDYKLDIPPSWRSWTDRFPVHNAAVFGSTSVLRSLLQGGQSASDPDDQDWTPLHYAAWFGNEDVVRVLMEDWQGAPSIQTPNGSTALHLAARNGHAEVVRLLVTCPIVEVSIKDNSGKTPLDVCETSKLNDWILAQRILTNPEKFMHAVNRFGKVQRPRTTEGGTYDFRIYFLDGTTKLLRLPSAEVSAQELRDAAAAMLQLPEELYKHFSIWIELPDFSFQLEPNVSPAKAVERAQRQLLAGDDGEGPAPDPASVKLVFKRDFTLTMHEERRVLSQVALKLLFDEALNSFTTSLWPTSVQDAVHLCGLLMQIRFGDHKAEVHKTGFLRDGLQTFVPAHLLHNQLKSAEWERRIYAAHRKHSGTTSVLSLHRLFLQYCRQWPFYGAVFFECQLLKANPRKKPEPVYCAVSNDWICVVSRSPLTLMAAFTWEEVTHRVDVANKKLTLELRLDAFNQGKLTAFQSNLMTIEDVQCVLLGSEQIGMMHAIMTKLLDKRMELEKETEKQRMAQGGPRVLSHVSTAPVVSQLSDKEREHATALQDSERLARYKFIHSFGQENGQTMKCAAIQVFDKYATHGLVHINDLNVLCYELGYWLGQEIDGARLFLSSTSNSFTFRDLVSWWTQASRSWLFILNDAAFKKRHEAVEIFLRNDPLRTGKVADEKLTGLINGLRSEELTRKTEAAIKQGLDPSNAGLVMFNSYVDWLAHMNIIDDCIL
eukprot:m.33423 g.33423  ORF g.33423 m.33423 type:complete len:1009 (-) comp9617_c0_seq3:316-3342(-)